ncbi:MAG: hypothetical protein UY91_C0015G0018, partial [Parcubacteria group bacterium GW2011_GWB1_55_9]
MLNELKYIRNILIRLVLGQQALRPGCEDRTRALVAP